MRGICSQCVSTAMNSTWHHVGVVRKKAIEAWVQRWFHCGGLGMMGSQYRGEGYKDIPFFRCTEEVVSQGML